MHNRSVKCNALCLSLKNTSLFVIGIFTSVLIIGCGVKPAEQNDLNTSENSLSLIGYFTDASSTPLSGLEVELSNSGARCTSDANGRCELSSSAITGDAEIQIKLSQNTVSVRLESISSQTTSVEYNVSVNQSQQIAELVSLNVEQPVDTDSDQDSAAPTPTPSEASPGASVTPTPKPTAKPTPKPTPKSDTPAKCLTCHADRGGPRCSSSSWVAIHKAVYKCKGKSLPLDQASDQQFMFELAQELQSLNQE